MYGRTFESMYEGSMVGAGINVFAVWNYIIVKARNGSVEINPKLLAFTLAGDHSKVGEIEAALEYLQKPDPESRSPLEGGRRIIKEGQFQYRLVNWQYYQQIKNAEDWREYNRNKQAEYRARKAEERKTARELKRLGMDGTPASGAYKAREARAQKLERNGDHEGAEEVAAEGTERA